MVLRVRATIGEWTASYATTHYTIEASYLESLEPDLASAVVRVANREHDEHSTMTAIAGRLFRDGEVKKASPIVGGPVPPIRKEEFAALV